MKETLKMHEDRFFKGYYTDLETKLYLPEVKWETVHKRTPREIPPAFLKQSIWCNCIIVWMAFIDYVHTSTERVVITYMYYHTCEEYTDIVKPAFGAKILKLFKTETVHYPVDSVA